MAGTVELKDLLTKHLTAWGRDLAWPWPIRLNRPPYGTLYAIQDALRDPANRGDASDGGDNRTYLT